jgi:hypothetical protein
VNASTPTIESPDEPRRSSNSTWTTASRSAIRAIAQLSHEDWERVAEKLEHAHGCEPDCPCCNDTAFARPPFDVLARYGPFVTSQAVLRVARLSKRSGSPFPRVSTDEVTQFCVEEAVFERLELEEASARTAVNELAAGGLDVGADGSVPGIELPNVGAKQAQEHHARLDELKGGR